MNNMDITHCHLNIKHMPGKGEIKEQIRTKINVETSASITDFQYNHNGSLLAVSDSDGYVSVLQRQGDNFVKISSFRADEAAIWKLSWADPSFGEVIAVGSFKRKIAVFHLRGGAWTQIAYHYLHQGSVNHVEWASPAFGCKLFSAGSEGSVAVLQLKKNSWVSSHFSAHECSVSCLAVRSLALNEGEEQRGGYPLIATAAKDNSFKIWKYTSEEGHNEGKYHLVLSYKAHKEPIRGILWKKRWTQTVPITYELFTCSEDGSVRLNSFIGEKVKQVITICEFEHPVFRISQSLSGNRLTVSVGEEEKSYIYIQNEKNNNWQLQQQLI